MADDQGYEAVGAYGGPYNTPVLDALARSGMRFDHCYSQPLCTPSRVQIMTGIYNDRNYVKFGVLDRSQTTFAHLFQQAGYATGVGGKWQLGKETDSPAHFGFEESCLWQHTRGRTKPGGIDSRYENPWLEINGKEVEYTHGEFGPDVVADWHCDFIKRHKDQPFLLYYPMILTHCPFVPPPDTPDWDPKSPGSKSYQGHARYFGAMVTHMDQVVGRIINQLEESGVRDRTLVLFTGDNGTDRPVVTTMKDGRKVVGRKGSTTDGGTRVPLIANWPGSIQPGQVSQGLVDFSDILPTICEAADVAVPERLEVDGRSFLPLLHGNSGAPRKAIYCWYSRSGNRKAARVFARNQRYKLYTTGEFYDISKDVNEKKDLGEAGPQDVRSTLQAVLDARRQYRN